MKKKSSLVLALLAAGGPHRLVVQGDLVVLNDVLIGDVWLLGGQSNMELSLADSDTGAHPYGPTGRPRPWPG
jgi:hypothetical protein